MNSDVGFRDDFMREVYCILGIPIDAAGPSTVLCDIDQAAAGKIPFLISTPNLNFMVKSQIDAKFRETLLLSDLCLPDGMPIIWFARLFGIPIKARVAGSDLFDALRLRPAALRPLKIFLFGSTEDVAGAAAKRVNSARGGIECVGWACPGFGDLDTLSEDRFIKQMNQSGADFLVVALGAQKGQLWLRRNHYRLQVPVRSHLGATINFQAGTIKRAPHAMRRAGFEWLWRIKEEPKLFGRYWRDGIQFLRLLVTRVIPLAFTSCWRARERVRHDFVIVSAHNEHALTLSISGAAVASQVPRAVARFREAVASGKNVVVDLSQTSLVDARFFGLFLMLKKQLSERGSRLHFFGASSALQRQFKLSGLGYLLAIGNGANVNTVD